MKRACLLIWFALALSGAGILKNKMENNSSEDVEEALYEEYLRAKPRLERGLSWIAIAAATAPLLGLLGTVTGMIHTFKLINIFNHCKITYSPQ